MLIEDWPEAWFESGAFPLREWTKNNNQKEQKKNEKTKENLLKQTYFKSIPSKEMSLWVRPGENFAGIKEELPLSQISARDSSASPWSHHFVVEDLAEILPHVAFGLARHYRCKLQTSIEAFSPFPSTNSRYRWWSGQPSLIYNMYLCHSSFSVAGHCSLFLSLPALSPRCSLFTPCEFIVISSARFFFFRGQPEFPERRTTFKLDLMLTADLALHSSNCLQIQKALFSQSNVCLS